jgi:hypothetical protein
MRMVGCFETQASKWSMKESSEWSLQYRVNCPIRPLLPSQLYKSLAGKLSVMGFRWQRGGWAWSRVCRMPWTSRQLPSSCPHFSKRHGPFQPASPWPRRPSASVPLPPPPSHRPPRPHASRPCRLYQPDLRTSTPLPLRTRTHSRAPFFNPM